MSRVEYKVIQIDGDYAHLEKSGNIGGELKLVARALLPSDIFEGCILGYENFEYVLML